MKIMLMRLGLGTVLWAVPYCAAVFLLPLQRSDPMAFKAAMVFLGSATGALLAAYYFMRVKTHFLREAILLATVWLILNWSLDIAALLPFSHQTLPQYFGQIGFEYIGLMAPVIAMGWLLDRNCAPPGSVS